MLMEPLRGQLFVISAPSGVGKTTLIRAILDTKLDLRFSISCTTRKPRAGETPGRDYQFVTHEEFVQGIQAGRFLEWAEVHGEYYGTDGLQVQRWLEAGHSVILDIDVQGARQVVCAHPSATTIFICPPSFDILRRRLEQRGTESREQVAKRLAAAREELPQAPWYDFVIINDVLEEAIADLTGIIRACGCERRRQAPRLNALLKTVNSAT